MVSINLPYEVSFARSARKELENLGKTVALRILKKIESLPENPRPAGCKKLTGQNSLWRIRIGDYRVVYSIDDTNRLNRHHHNPAPKLSIQRLGLRILI